MKNKNLHLKARTARGKERVVSGGPQLEFSVFPSSYDENFDEFPIKFRVVQTPKGPIIHILGSNLNVVQYDDKN